MIATAQNGFWVLPSRRRPESLKRFINAYLATGASTRVLILLSPGDDVYRRPMPHTFAWLPVDSNCQGDKMRYLRTMECYWMAEWVGWLNDDQVPVTKEWDLKIIEHLNGKNFVSSNDEWQPERMVGACAFSRQLIDLIGGFYPQGLHHQYADDILETIGTDCKCWVKLKDVIVHHHHHLNRKAELDSTYRQNESFAEIDARRYKKWLVQEYPEIKKRVLKFIEG